MGPSERRYAVEGPMEENPVGTGISVGCALGDIFGPVVPNPVGVYVGTIIGDGLGPGMGCWGIEIERRRTNQKPLPILLRK